MNTSELKETLGRILKVGLVPFIHGSPALGKSDIVKQVARDFNLSLIDLRLSQLAPEDLLGLPSFNEDKTKARYVPFNVFPLEGDELDNGTEGWLIFLDEFNAASLSTQAAAFKLVLDRMVGEFKLHKNVAIVCAGNKSTDRGITNRISTPMASRLIHLELEVDTNIWIDWAIKNDIDHRIISYIRFRPDHLHSFNPNHDDHTFPSPRTYEFLSKIIKGHEITYKDLPVMSGCIGIGTAREFLGFSEIYTELPTIKEILANPERDISTEPSVLYALSGLVAHHITKDNIATLMIFIQRMPIEFSIITLRQGIAKDTSLISHEALSKWIEQNQESLL